MSLKQIIHTRGLKQSWVASQLGISAPRFSYMARGALPFPDDKIKDLARVLSVTQAEIRRALNGGSDG